MTNLLVFTLLLLTAGPVIAQVGIGTNTPDPSSALDMQETEKGLLIPRLTRLEKDAIVNPATGLIIYQTNDNPGFYYYNSTAWITFNGAGWELSGNNGTSPSINYVGTADAQSLVLGAQNTELIRILSNGNVGIGTVNPSTPLHLVGANTPTTIYQQTFDTVAAGAITTIVGNNPYTINNNTGSCSGTNGVWQVDQNSTPAGSCTSCIGNRAILINSSSLCDVNTTMVLGTFSSPNGRIQVGFNYSLELSNSSLADPVALTAMLFNETTNTVDQTIVTVTNTQANINFNEFSNIEPNDTYSLRIQFIGNRFNGLSIDNVLIQDLGTPLLRIVDGTEVNNRVLISDVNGNTTWEDLITLNLQDDWVFPTTSNSNLDPIYHQGNVMIGSMTAPSHTLHVRDGNATSGTRAYWGSVEYVLDGIARFRYSNSVNPMIDNAINVGSPSNKWTAVFSDNGMVNTSDVRLKENIKSISYGLDEVLRLKPVSFQWKKEQFNDYVIPAAQQETKLGLIAQELLTVIPEVVQTKYWKEYEKDPGVLHQKEMERLAVSYSELIPVLVKAIQEQQSQIEELEKQQKRLKKLKEQL